MFLQNTNDIRVKALFYAIILSTQKLDIIMQIFCRQSIMDWHLYASSAIFNSSQSFENALRSCVSFLMQLCLAWWLEVYATNVVITFHPSMSEKDLLTSQILDQEENFILLGMQIIWKFHKHAFLCEIKDVMKIFSTWHFL